MSTDQGAVVDAGGSAVGVVDDVVGLAVLGWAVAAGECASAVSGYQCQALAFGEQPAPEFDVGDGFGFVEHDGHEPGVGVGPAVGGGGGDDAAVAGGGVPGAVDPVVQVAGHDDAGGDPGGGGELFGPDQHPDGVDERVVAALPGGAGVFDAVGVGGGGGE